MLRSKAQSSIDNDYILINGDEIDDDVFRDSFSVRSWEIIVNIFLSTCGVNAGWWNEEICWPTKLWEAYHWLVGFYLVANFIMALFRGSETYGSCLSLNAMTDVIVATAPIAFMCLKLVLTKEFYDKYSSIVGDSPRKTCVIRREVLIAIFFTVPMWIFGIIVQLEKITYWYNYSVVVDFLKFGVPAIHNMFIRTSAGMFIERIEGITTELNNNTLQPKMLTARCQKTTKEFKEVTSQMRFWIIISTFLNLGTFAVGVLAILLDFSQPDTPNTMIICESFGPSMKYIAEWGWFFLMWFVMVIGIAEVSKRHKYLIKVVNESPNIDPITRTSITSYLSKTSLPFNFCGEQITYLKIGKILYIVASVTIYSILRFNS